MVNDDGPIEPADHATDRPTTVLAGRARRESVRWVAGRERVRNSLAVVPVFGLVAGWLLARVLSTRALNENLARRIDEFVGQIAEDERRWVWFSAATFETVTATVAAAMLTFVGVVFSLSILALQVASSQLSPRIMRTFVRSRVVTWTLAVFLATFVYAVTVLSAIRPASTGSESFEPFIAYYVLLGLVAATLGMFVAYVSHVVRLIRIQHILDAVVAETQDAIDQAGRRVVERRQVPEPVPPVIDGDAGGDVGGVVVERIEAPRSGVLDLVGIDGLSRVADEHDVVLVVRARVGEHLVAGQVLVEAHGASVDRSRVLRELHLGAERTLYDDPAFGLRQIVDVAVRALSPAVNDPTTAVQAIDRLVELLALIGRAPDQPEHWIGAEGDRVRVVLPTRSWADLVDLAFAEIVGCGCDAPQVVRRLLAAIEDLDALLPVSRQASLRRWRDIVKARCSSIGVDTSRADRSGLG